MVSDPVTANKSGCQGEVELVMGTPACSFMKRGVPRANPGTDAEVRRGTNSAGTGYEVEGVLGWRECTN